MDAEPTEPCGRHLQPDPHAAGRGYCQEVHEPKVRGEPLQGLPARQQSDAGQDDRSRCIGGIRRPSGGSRCAAQLVGQQAAVSQGQRGTGRFRPGRSRPVRREADLHIGGECEASPSVTGNNMLV